MKLRRSDSRSLETVKTGFRASVAIQFGAKYVNIAVHLIISMILARILTPNEYGVMSLVSVFIGLFSILSNVGINAAIIQYRELDNNDCGALFSFTLILGVLLAIVFSVISLPVSIFYNNKSYIAYMCVSSISVVFHSANMVPNGMLVRDKKFLAIGIRTVLTSLICGIICIFLALAGWGIYALILNNVLSAMTVLVWNITASKIPLGIWDFREQLKIVGRFSSYQFISQLIQYLIRNMDNLAIGACLGTTALGYYDKAYKLSKYPVDIVPSTLTPVLKSFFSSAKGDLDEIYRSYIRVEKALSIIGVFASAICITCANEMIILAFGSQWTESIESFRVLGASLAFQMVNFTVFSVLEAARRTDLLMRHTIISGSIMTALLFAGLSTGSLIWTSRSVTIGFVLYTVTVLYYVVFKVFKKNVLQYIMLFIPEFFSGFVTATIINVSYCFVNNTPLYLSFIMKLITGIIIYTIMLHMLDQMKYVYDVIGIKKKR